MPLGVGTGLVIPSAVTPTITNLPAKSGKLFISTYSTSSNVLLNLIYAVPFGCVIIGSKGVEKIIELDLSSEEKNNFKKSIDSVRELFNAASAIDPSLS